MAVGIIGTTAADTLYVYSRTQGLKKIPTKDIDSITFSVGPKITDIAGNAYPIVAIGSQIWMAENLRTHLYNDGTPIVRELNAATLSSTSTGTYTWYNVDSMNYDLNYGKLYNGFAAMHPTKNVCPVGWRVPTEADINILQTYVSTIAPGNVGGALKDNLLLFWSPPNSGAINTSGFSAQPSGHYDANTDMFKDINLKAYFWTSTPIPMSPNTRLFRLDNNSTLFFLSGTVKNTYLPIRCIQN